MRDAGMNSEAINIYVYILINFFNMAIIIRYMNAVYGDFKAGKSLFYAIAVIITLFFSIFISFEMEYINLVALSAHSMLLLPFYKRSAKSKVLFSLLLLLIAGLCQSIAHYIIDVFSLPFMNMAVLSTHIAFAVLTEIISRLYKRGKEVDIPRMVMVILISIPIASMIVIPCSILLTQNSSLDYFNLLMLVLPINTIILFINMSMFYMFNRIVDLIDIRNEKAVLEKQILWQNKYYTTLNENQKTVRQLQHDMQNNFQAIDYLLKDGKYEKAKILLDELTKKTSVISKVISTGNDSIDSILNIKITSANEENIQVRTKISIPEKLEISFESAIAVLGNLLDNAIEACCKLPTDKRYIDINLNYIINNSTLMIQIINSADIGQLSKEELLKTNKKNKVLHGIGLSNVKMAVNGFGGVLDFTINPKQFCVTAVLYL